jgi:hypothetical protein
MRVSHLVYITVNIQNKGTERNVINIFCPARCFLTSCSSPGNLAEGIEHGVTEIFRCVPALTHVD